MVDPTREEGVRTPNSQINNRVVPGSLRDANPLPTNRLEHRAALRNQQNLTQMRDAQVHPGPVVRNGGQSPEGQRISAELSKQAQARQAAEQANTQKFESTRQKVGGPNLRAAGAGAGPTQAPGAAAAGPTGRLRDSLTAGSNFLDGLTGQAKQAYQTFEARAPRTAAAVSKVGNGLQKVANSPLGKVTKFAGGAGGAFAFHHGELAPGTLPPEILAQREAMDKHLAAGGTYENFQGPSLTNAAFNDAVARHNANPNPPSALVGGTEKPSVTAPGTAPATPAPGANTTPARAAAGLPPVKTGADAKLTAAQLNGYYDRSGMTNEQVGAMNPNGQIVVTRQPNGVMSFSDGGRPITSGPVSYVGADGKALPGQGLRGQGWGNFQAAPADSNVVTGPNGSYAYSNTPNQRDSSSGGNGVTGRTEYADGQVPQIIQDARRSQAESSARAQQLGVDIGGMAPWQANQYMDQVQQARNINASQQANAGSYEERLKQLNDPTSDISKAMKKLTGDIPDQIKGRGRLVAEYQQKQAALAAGLAGDYLGETDRIRKDGTTRYGYDTQGESSRYSTDMNAAVNRENNAARLMADMQNAEVERTGNQRKADEGRREKTQKRLDEVFTTLATKDGEVNPQRLAYLRNASESYVATTADALEAAGRPEEAARLREQGVGALSDPSTFQRFMGGLHLDNKVNEGYWGHERVASANPAGRSIARRDGNTVYMDDGSTLPYGALAYENGRMLPDRWGNWDPTSDRVDTSTIDPYNRLHGKQ